MSRARFTKKCGCDKTKIICQFCYGTGRSGGILGHAEMLSQKVLARLVKKLDTGGFTLELLQKCGPYQTGDLVTVGSGHFILMPKEKSANKS